MRGSCAVNAAVKRTSPPGPTGEGSGTRITVRSSALPSSGASKAADFSTSVPSASASFVRSIQPHPFTGMSTSRNWPPDSRMKVERLLRNAFR